MRPAVILALLALGVAGCGNSSTSTGPSSAQIYFMQGEQFHPVERDLAPGVDAPFGALEELFAGPTAAEQQQGIDTALPDEIRLESVSVRGPTATVEVSHAQTEPTPLDVSLRPARAAQIVYTLTDLPGIEQVVIEVNGETRAQFEGETLSVDGTLDRNDLTHPVPLPSEPAAVPTGPAPADPAAVQQRLVALHYLPDGAVTGTWDYGTQQAVFAFQGWEGLARDGTVGPETLARLEHASPPQPTRGGSGHHVEVYTGRGVTLLVDNGSLVRALHSSSGAPGYETPRGSYEVFRKEEQSWSVPYQVWLPWASYFDGGIALHESGDVPAFPASHGCVRLPSPDAEVSYEFAPVGTPVDVY